MLEITDVQVFPIKDAKGKLKAFAKIVLNDSLMLSSLRIYEGANGLFVSYPHEPNGADYRQIFYPLTKELRDEIQEKVLAQYEKVECYEEI